MVCANTGTERLLDCRAPSGEAEGPTYADRLGGHLGTVVMLQLRQSLFQKAQTHSLTARGERSLKWQRVPHATRFAAEPSLRSQQQGFRSPATSQTRACTPVSHTPSGIFLSCLSQLIFLKPCGCSAPTASRSATWWHFFRYQIQGVAFSACSGK